MNKPVNIFYPSLDIFQSPVCLRIFNIKIRAQVYWHKKDKKLTLSVSFHGFHHRFLFFLPFLENLNLNLSKNIQIRIDIKLCLLGHSFFYIQSQVLLQKSRAKYRFQFKIDI